MKKIKQYFQIFSGTNLIFIGFLILKLTGTGQVATWSWWWVCSPLWLPLVLVLFMLLIIAFVAIIKNIIKLARGDFSK